MQLRPRVAHAALGHTVPTKTVILNLRIRLKLRFTSQGRLLVTVVQR